MALSTPLCDLLHIEHPVMLAGMGGVAYAPLAAAVSQAGGYGVLGMAGASPDFIAGQMREVRRRTDRPFGVDLLAAMPQHLPAAIEVIIAEGASSFVAGLGVPVDIIARLKAAGLKVMVVCASVRHALKAQEAGCDAVICQGGEGGGHTGLVGTMPLVAQAVTALDIPVVAAGGIFDGRGLAAALALGADGVWLGTRFIATIEAHAGQLYQQAILDARDEDTIRTRCFTGKPLRALNNSYIADWEGRPQDIQQFPMQAMVSIQANAMGGLIGQTEGLDPARSCFAMGQSAGGIDAILPAGDVVRAIVDEASAVIARLQSLKS